MKHRVLAVRDLAVAIDGRPILREIGFQADAGEFIGVIGPNGAGKSTLLRALRNVGGGQATGSVRLYGEAAGSLSDRRLARRIAYMQQDVNLEFGFTAREIVMAGRYPYIKWWRGEGAADHAAVRRAMAFTGVDKLAAKSAREASGGERQRILLAKALAQETPLLLLDEPTASLDLTYQEEIFRYCQRVCAPPERKTVLMVVHDIRMAAKFCSRLILLADGRVVADGAPAAVVTAANLERAYGLHAQVFHNPVSGSLDLHTYRRPPARRRVSVHILGGGDGASDWIRLLFEKGYTLSGGVFCEGEIDAATARVFGVPSLFVASHEAIAPLVCVRAGELRDAADWTLLPELVYTPQNLHVLHEAWRARRVLIVEDSPVAGRDFSDGRAAALYEQLVLRPRTRVVTSRRLRRLIGIQARQAFAAAR